MKIYVAHASGWDYETQLYDVLAHADLKADFIFPHRDAAIQKNSKSTIESCDLMLAEVSYPSTGLGIEIAWACAAAIPILAIHRMELKPSSALNSVTRNINSYEDSNDLLHVLKNFLSHTLSM